MCTKIKVLTHTRGHVVATCPWHMSAQHFLVCEVTLILPQVHVPATRPYLISVQFSSVDVFAISCTKGRKKTNYLNTSGEEAQEKLPGLLGMGCLS